MNDLNVFARLVTALSDDEWHDFMQAAADAIRLVALALNREAVNRQPEVPDAAS